MKDVRLALSACLVIFLFASSAHAGSGCSVGTLDDKLKHSDVAAIFKGSVTSVQQVPPSLTFPRERRQIATMTVTRVWKGEVAATTALHLWLTAPRPGDGFQPGVEYLAIAHELSPESRAWFKLPWTGPRALGVNGWGACSVMLASDPAAVRLIGSSAGYLPN